MECNSWSCWSGWAGVSGIAQILSLAAIVIAVIDLVIRHRRIRPVVWGFDLFGTASMGGETYHLAELTNGGSGTASITTVSFVEARPIQTPEYRFQSVVGPGERVTILLSSEEITRAWLVIVWRSDADGTAVRLEWLPVANPGAMRDEFERSLDRTRALGPFRNLSLNRRARPVGPMHFQQAWCRWSRDAEKNERLFAKMWSGTAAVGPEMFPWSHAPTKPVDDLPYVAVGSE